MSSFLRGKQVGLDKDLSEHILPDSFALDYQESYGLGSQISCLAYDAVQSILAIGTNDTKFGPGTISLFGYQRVTRLIEPAKRVSIQFAQFTANRLVTVDSREELAVWDLDTGNKRCSCLIPGKVSALATDPMLDWALIGTSHGDIYAFDLDRERLTNNFRLPNFWRARAVEKRSTPAAQRATLLGLALHPRDIGKILITYSHGAVVYSLKQGMPTAFLEYMLPQHAPGGNAMGMDLVRYPQIQQSAWHPSGTFIVTAHDDGSLVFWDPKDERIVMARSLMDVDVNKPVANPQTAIPVEPFTKLSWCCKQNPDDTGLLVAGGCPVGNVSMGLTFIDLGPTPIYATSSWQVLADHFKAKKQTNLPIPVGAVIADYILIPRSTPHFAGAHDPIAIIALLTSGELVTLSFPSGYPITPTNKLHPSLSLVHPYATKFAVSAVGRVRWLGMTESRQSGEPILRGGAGMGKNRHVYQDRTILQVAHGDSTIRIWDSGHGDEIDNPEQLQVDMARSLNRYENIDMSAMDMASSTGEFAAGTAQGEVVIFRWAENKNLGIENNMAELQPASGTISNIIPRAEPNLRVGLMPSSLYQMDQGRVTVIKVSDVGFVAIGSENGGFSIIDLRGPTVMLSTSVVDFSKPDKRSSFIKSHRSSASVSKEWPTAIEFGVMTVEGDSYSSILCFVGTSLGRVATFKIVPANETYTASLAGAISGNDRVVALCPIIADSGRPALATGNAVAGLRNGEQVHGLLVAVTQTEMRIFKPASSKGASKSFSDIFCDAANVTHLESQGAAIVGIFGDMTTRAFSIPGLKEINKTHLKIIDPSRSTSAKISPSGHLFVWTGPSQLAVMHAWGAGRALPKSLDTILNPDLETPTRPTISNLQWMAGTQYVSPADFDLLLGGPDRPPSKRMLAASEAERIGSSKGPATGNNGPNQTARVGAAAQDQEGWGEYLTRQLNERTEKLNILNDGAGGLADQSSSWAEDANKYVNKQKKNMFLAGLKRKLF
ncbi:Lethal(2) giant larvae protein -like protein SRO77 [Ceratocystis fimbriata CBS 114723]|uniref:Lethal(2) giant larvae protein-like protein SRO77 n=1 Tax=Ceratocystis fimbriata CBS 114723 TaxID=1035309 RepID=A0A2C5WW82_9PEZI|nr:Lethal(2) giant larvae protein -like protein SRO77 [Ceratocystis fimbriata CBS 114723]